MAKCCLINYLSNRKIRCKIQLGSKEHESDYYDISIGTPQGSCLGPLLFLIFVNDLQLNLIKNDCILFADDTTLYKTGPKLNDVVRDIQIDIIISYWFKANILSLNINKTNCTVFGSKGQPSVATDNIAIVIVTSMKSLGIIIYENMSWKEHTASLINNLISQKCMLQLVRKSLPIQAKGCYTVHIY